MNYLMQLKYVAERRICIYYLLAIIQRKISTGTNCWKISVHWTPITRIGIGGVVGVNKWKPTKLEPIKRGEGDGSWDSLRPSDYIIICLFGTVDGGWPSLVFFLGFHKGGSRKVHLFCVEIRLCQHFLRKTFKNIFVLPLFLFFFFSFRVSPVYNLVFYRFTIYFLEDKRA